MTIKQFAIIHRLRTTIDADGSTIIKGSNGHIYEHSRNKLGMMFMSDKFTTRQAWNNRRRDGLSVGMQLHQDGDYEGSMLFDASNAKQTEVAIRITSVRQKHNQSESQLANLTDTHRFKVCHA